VLPTDLTKAASFLLRSLDTPVAMTGLMSAIATKEPSRKSSVHLKLKQNSGSII
jgi:hypothetical protein